MLLAVGVSPAVQASVTGISSISQAANTSSSFGDCCNNNNTCSTPIDERTNFTGHTFFSVRPQFQSSSPELITLFRGDRTRRNEGNHGAFGITFFGGKSTDSDKLAQYFMPFGKTELLVGEFGSNAVQTNTADVIANYFGVMTGANANGSNTFDMVTGDFESVISFRPRQSVFGIGLAWRQSFAGDCGQGWFVQASTPIEWVKNQLAFNETIITTGTAAINGFASSMTAALCGAPVLNFSPATLVGTSTFLSFPGGTKAFQYGKISCGNSNSDCGNGLNTGFNNIGCGDDRVKTGDCNSRSRWGLADIELNVGYEWFGDEDAYSDLWVGLVFPTGNRPNGEFIFEPIIGNNKHWALNLGGTYAYELWKSCECDTAIWVELNICGRYFAPNTQRRSFDLIDKQWSRYMWVYPSSTSVPFQGIQPGINYFTQDMRVSPRFDRDANTAFIFRGQWCEAEVGYNFYARSGEDVRLCNPTAINGIGLVGFPVGNIAFPTALTASNSTIRRFLGTQSENVFDNNFVTTAGQFIPLTEQDINYASAAAPTTITHTFYGSIGKTWDNCARPVFANLGGSYEFSADNSGLDRWLLWFKVGFSY
jgi:hypothetical protein